MMRIKMCGLHSRADIEAVNEVLPEYAGFVFVPNSHRGVTLDEARALSALLDDAICPVGVFLDAPVAFVAAACDVGAIRMVQLHGCEDEAYVAALRKRVSAPIIQSFVVSDAADVQRALASSADYVLLDAGRGDGRAFDWSLVANVQRAFFLAGGLDSENVAQAVRAVRPFAVDVSSGIETNKTKDIRKMRAFAMAVRAKGEL